VVITVCRRMGCKNDEEREKMKVQAWKIGLLGAFVVYPSVSATVLRVFHCREIEDYSYLVADYRIICKGKP